MNIFYLTIFFLVIFSRNFLFGASTGFTDIDSVEFRDEGWVFRRSGALSMFEGEREYLVNEDPVFRELGIFNVMNRCARISKIAHALERNDATRNETLMSVEIVTNSSDGRLVFSHVGFLNKNGEIDSFGMDFLDLVETPKNPYLNSNMDKFFQVIEKVERFVFKSGGDFPCSHEELLGNLRIRQTAEESLGKIDLGVFNMDLNRSINALQNAVDQIEAEWKGFPDGAASLRNLFESAGDFSAEIKKIKTFTDKLSKNHFHKVSNSDALKTNFFKCSEQKVLCLLQKDQVILRIVESIFAKINTSPEALKALKGIVFRGYTRMVPCQCCGPSLYIESVRDDGFLGRCVAGLKEKSTVLKDIDLYSHLQMAFSDKYVGRNYITGFDEDSIGSSRVTLLKKGMQPYNLIPLKELTALSASDVRPLLELICEQSVKKKLGVQDQPSLPPDSDDSSRVAEKEQGLEEQKKIPLQAILFKRFNYWWDSDFDLYGNRFKNTFIG